MDWTDHYGRKKLSDLAEKIVKELIIELYTKKLPVHSKHNIKPKELGLLYRSPLYIGVNTFLERLVRTLYDIDKGLKGHYTGGKYKPSYYNHTGSAFIVYFNSVSANAQLLNNLTEILSENIDLELKEINLHDNANETNKTIIYKRQYTLMSGMRFLKRNLIHTYLSFTKIYLKSSVAYECSKWLNMIFPINQRIIELPYKHFPADLKTRGKIKECCNNVFLNNTAYFDDKINNSKKQQLSNLFAVWIDHIIPLSLIEGLPGRFNYYAKMLTKWDIKQVHSCIGWDKNDNFKCFSILAKRKNAKLIGHEHGANNFSKYFPDRNDLSPFYKDFGNLYINDYYLPWGDPRRNPGDAWDDVEQTFDIKILPSASVYLSTLKKWKKSDINQRELTLLYPSGALRTFMATLQEITPEKNLLHRNNVLEMLKKLLDQHYNLKILYKTFMGIDLSNDPITKKLSKYIDQGRVQMTSAPPIELMRKVDIALFDILSTGFAEAVQIGIPTLVYNNEYDYKTASDEGKIINDELKDCGVLFYDTESGIKSFERIINDLPAFQSLSKEPISHFQEAIAYPVNKEQFLESIDKRIELRESEYN